MRTLGTLLFASALTAAIVGALNRFYAMAFFFRPLPAFNDQLSWLFESWVIGAIFIFLVNVVIGLPVLVLFRHVGMLNVFNMMAAGAVAGFALGGMYVTLVPDSDLPVNPTLMQKVYPGLWIGIAGALSGAVLGSMLAPRSNCTRERETIEKGARPLP
jgi:hypothetical protein